MNTWGKRARCATSAPGSIADQIVIIFNSAATLCVAVAVAGSDDAAVSVILVHIPMPVGPLVKVGHGHGDARGALAPSALNLEITSQLVSPGGENGSCAITSAVEAIAAVFGRGTGTVVQIPVARQPGDPSDMEICADA